MPFNILNSESGETVNSLLTHNPVMFETAEEANAVAREMARTTGAKYRIKRVLDDSWRRREQRKIEDGTYEPLPWECAEWWMHPMSQAIWKDHYPHPSMQEPGKIAYTESPEKGMDDIRTQIRPGRYLEKFKKALDYYGYDLKQIAHDFEHSYKPAKVFFATTEDEIQWVYENGIESCMGSREHRIEHGWGYPNKGDWPADYHACRAYAAGDLQVAYLREDEEDEDSMIVARALVWPQRKTHSRIYGDESRLKRMLMASGYDYAQPIGAKIQRKPHGKRFIVPYIDAGTRGGQGALAVLDREEHLEICPACTPHSYNANNVTGLSGSKCNARGQENAEYLCEYCDEECTTVHRVALDDRCEHRRLWCEDCTNEHAFYCQGSDHYFAIEVPYVEMANGTLWTLRRFNSAGFICQGNGKRYSRNESIRLETGELWSNQYYLTHGFRSSYSGKRWKNTDMMVLPDGSKVSNSEYMDFYFQCRSCSTSYLNQHKSRRHMAGDICRDCDAAAQSVIASDPTQPTPTVSDEVVAAWQGSTQ